MSIRSSQSLPLAVDETQLEFEADQPNRRAPGEGDATPSSAEVPPVLPHHFPALDGIRGLAVAGVLLFHSGQLTGGYLGVDLFFVLSGFLITGLLIKEYRTSSGIALSRFWVRRARRLMPALIALLVGVCLVSAIVADPVDLSRIRSDGIGTLLYVANWTTIFAGRSYWELFAAPSPLEHTWSLAIEEQFYLVWPFLLWALFKFTKASLKMLLVLCLGLAVLSEIALWVLFDPANTSRAYQGTDTRGAAILLGAALASALSIWGPVKGPRARAALEWAAGVAFVVLAYFWFTLDGQSSLLYRGGFLLTEVAVLVVLMSAVHPTTGWLSKVTSFGPFVGLGLISYGVYLYHVPIYQILNEERLGLGGWALTGIRIGITLLVAIASYFALEQPIRRGGVPSWAPARVAVPAILLFTLVVIYASTSAATDTVDLAADAGIASGTGFANTAPGATRILFEGDSVGASLGAQAAAVSAAAGNRPAIVSRAFPGCSVFAQEFKTRTSDKHVEGDPIDCDATWSADAEELKPDIAVVLLGGPTKADIQLSGEWVPPCDARWNQEFQRTVTNGLQGLAKNSKRVVLVNTPRYVAFGNKVEGREWVDCANTAYAQIAAQNPKFMLLDLDGYLCPGGECRQDDELGRRLRPDGVHFKGDGGRSVAEWVLTSLPQV